MNAIAVTVDDASSLRWGLEYPLQDTRQIATPSIRLGGRVPPWAHAVVDRIVDLATLPAPDLRGGRAMDVEDVMDALEFLQRVMRDDTAAPWIGRLSSGGVQLTWRSGDVEVEAVFDRAREEREVIVSVGENEWDAPTREADSLFGSVVDRLSSGRVEYATTN